MKKSLPILLLISAFTVFSQDQLPKALDGKKEISKQFEAFTRKQKNQVVPQKKQSEFSRIPRSSKLINSRASTYTNSGPAAPTFKPIIEKKAAKQNQTSSVELLGPVITSDSSALVALYNALSGPAWNNNTNWLQPGQNVETWHGVTVVGNRVTEINLAANNLVGIIPSQIGDLDQLVSLNLSENSIEDELPLDIGNLTNLQYLDIYGNQLIGGIPISFQNLIFLDYLDLSNNLLEGEISHLTSLINLTQLYLHNNGFYGSIPSDIESIAGLQRLYLYNNFFDGEIPTTLGNISSLQYIFLNGNQLSGTIPPQLGNLSNLIFLQLSANSLSGELPIELAFLEKLQSLYLDYNQLTGSVPSEYTNMGSLQFIDLRYNQLSGDFPDALLNMPALLGVYLSGNQLTGPLPNFSVLPNLTYLIIDANQFDGPIPASLGDVSNLQTLNLGGNLLEGQIPPELGNLSNLELLRIWSMPGISGSIPSEIGNLTFLYEIDIAFNSLSGSIPNSLGNLTNLQTLWLQGNEFDGAIPNTFSSLSLLDQLSIRDNNFTGLPDLTSLTPSYFDISLNFIPQADIDLNASVITNNIGQKGPTIEADSLALVALYEFTNGDSWNNNENWLEGPVTDWYGITSADGRVLEIRLAGNNLRPSFDAPEFMPEELADLTQLTSLDFNSNFLSSGIIRKFPNAFYTLSSLQEVILTNCSIGGTLPTNAFPNVSHLELWGNRYEGGLDFIANSTASSINYIEVAFNDFDDLPDLSGKLIDFLRVEFNNLTFEDIEPNIGLFSSFFYEFQNPYGQDTIIYDLTDPLNLDFTVGGSANQYQWLLDGDTLVGETLPTLTISPGEEGDYQLQVSSSLVPGMILNSGRYRITTAPPFNQNPSSIYHSYQLSKTTGEGIRTSLNVGDMNGDGVDDFAVAYFNEIDIYFGNRQLAGRTPDITYTLAEGETMGNVAAGFFNADAHGDIILSKYVSGDFSTNAIVVLEGADGLDQASLNTIEFSFGNAASEFGLSSYSYPLNVMNIGDINNDGFNELGMSTGGFNSGGSEILIYYGGQSTYDALSDKVTPPPSGSFAYKMIALQDINGDDIDDFGVMNANFSGNPEIYAIYFGAQGKTDFQDADLLVDLASSSLYDGQESLWVSTTADVNGDTHKDILFRTFYANDPNFPSEGTTSLFIIYGGPGIDDQIDDAIRLPGNSDDLRSIDRWGGNHLMNVGDYDEDGADDILVSAFSSSWNGQMFSAANLSESTVPEKIINAPNNANLGAPNNYTSFQFSNAVGDFNDNGLIDVMLSQPVEGGYDLYFYENFEPPGDLFYDSIALVSLYQSTDGDNWTNNSNWLSGNVDTWNGVDVTTSRVTTIDLSGNGLSGGLASSFDKLQNLEVLNLSDNELSGTLSNSVNLLPNLTSINLANNEITGIPDFNNALGSLTTIDVSENRLTFDDLEPVVNLSSLIYADQKNIKLNQLDTVLVPVGRDRIISVSTGGTANTYRWRYNGSNISDSSAANSSFTVENIDRSNMGKYQVRVQNSNVPNLTIFSDEISVLATAIVTTEVTDFDGNQISEEVSGSLMQTVVGARGYDTLSIAVDVPSFFDFSPVILKDYLVGISSDPEKYVDTYFKNTFLWEEADVLKLFSDTTVQIKMTSVPGPTEGEGIVRGTIEEDFSDDGGRIDARRRAAKRKCGLRKRRRGGRIGQDDEFELIAYGETNANGEFEYGFLPEGTYRFFVEYPGIPLDESSFVQFDIGEAGVTDDEFVLAAVVTENGITVELVLGITSEFFTDFKIYPNPSTDFINIGYDRILSEKMRADLIDMNGKILMSREVAKGKNESLQMDMRPHPQGQYILKFVDLEKNKTALTFRVIKR